MDHYSILQWNCRGIRANLPDLQLLLTTKVQIACLQETRLPPNSDFSIKHFSTYNHNPHPLSQNNTPINGITTLIDSSIHIVQFLLILIWKFKPSESH